MVATEPLVTRTASRQTQALALARLVLASGSGALLLVADATESRMVAAGLLLAVAVGGSIPLTWPTLRDLQAPAEAVLASLVILSVEPLPEELLPYLLAPALAGGLLRGTRVAVTTAGLAAATLLLGHFLGEESAAPTAFLASVSRWALLTLAVGLLGAWVHRLQQRGAEPQDAAYASAYRLISQLRLVARQLSGGLDPVSIAHGMLSSIRGRVPFDRGAVYVRSAGGRLTPIAFAGAERLDWPVDHPLFEEAWASSAPVRAATPLTAGADKRGYAAVVPLRIGLRTYGLIAVEREYADFDGTAFRAAEDVAQEQALRLETALLFSEVRSLATAEERRRLAREIHDGIAQELASLGYVVDDLAARARYLPDLERDLKSLRGELTRVISELRLSIFDLRTDVDSTVGLGTALSDYVRQVGAGSAMTVHLSLDETPVRLPVDVEMELLRIGQEAVTNARKHANAENLWVTCRVDPPSVLLRIEDDGAGLGRSRVDSFGLEVMRERAQRIGAELSVRPRPDRGTVVEARIGSIVEG